MKNVRIQEVEDQHSRLFIALPAGAGDAMNPSLVLEFLLRNSLGNVKELLGDEAFELAKRLSLKDVSDLFSLRGCACTQNQLAKFREKRPRRIQNLPLELFPTLTVG